MRAAIYARVSTLNGQSLEMQLAELREYASRRGFDGFFPMLAASMPQVAGDYRTPWSGSVLA